MSNKTTMATSRENMIYSIFLSSLSKRMWRTCVNALDRSSDQNVHPTLASYTRAAGSIIGWKTLQRVMKYQNSEVKLKEMLYEHGILF